MATSLGWISPVDRARLGLGNDVLSRLDALENVQPKLLTLNLGSQTLAEVSGDTGLITVAALYLGTGDPLDLTTNPTGVFIVSPGITISGTTYNFLTMLNGVLQVGITTTSGQVQSGNGSGIVDANGFRVFNGATEVGRFGDLNGFLNYVVQTFGIAIGSSTAYLTYDATNGLRIKGTIAVFGVFPHAWDAWDEDMDISPDGTTVNFSVANVYVAGTLQIILNGIWLKSGGNDYSEGAADTIYMNSAPQTGDVLICNYVRSDTLGNVYNEVPAGAINGSNTSFTTAHSHVAGSLELYLNGVTLSFGDDYRNAMRTFIFNSAPLATDTIEAAYLINSNSNFIFQEVPTMLHSLLTLAHNYVAGTPIVVVNGVKQTITNDYTESGANTITLTYSPDTPGGVGNSNIWITYIKA